jgi:phosphohistidine phosphatase SixA
MLRRTLLLAALMLSLPAQAADWSVASGPGLVLMMRHASAPGTGDPRDFRLNDCSTQRNLSDAGRRQAQAIGEGLRAAGVAPARVMTSQWCRTRETAALLGLGAPQDLPALNSFFEDRSTARAQTDDLRAWLAALLPDETVVLVTHQVNITALTGEFAASGSTVVLSRAGGGLRILAELPAP